MSKYKLRARVKIFLADLVPGRLRAVIYLDAITSVMDSEYMRSMEYSDGDNQYGVLAISGWDLETLRREAIRDINGGELPTSPKPKEEVEK